MPALLPTEANKRDSLTGLPVFDAAFKTVQGQSWGSMMLLNLDRLRQCNAAQGVKAGDEALVRTVMALNDLLPALAFVARVQADEFVALLKSSVHDATWHAQTVRLRIDRALRDRFGVTATIGVGDASPLYERLVFMRAQVCVAKRRGGNTVVELWD